MSVSIYLMLFVITASPQASGSSLYHVGSRVHGWKGGTQVELQDEYLDHIQPILSARCVACHGCYEAPCQLNLESYEGLRRGFNPEPLYSGKRTRETKPTRMIDATSLAEWRSREFLPVVGHDTEAAHGQHRTSSLLYRFIDQSSQHNAPGFDVMTAWPIQSEFLKTEKHQCVAKAETVSGKFSGDGNNPWGVISFEAFIAQSRHAGMPFALPRLEATETARLKAWLERGAPGPSVEAQAALERSARPETVTAWEDFLNGDSAKAQLSARYLYEHLFSAQLHFAENPGEYFEIVRSRTRSGAIDPIVTELPYSDPGVSRVYYRLHKLTRALAHKTQIVWQADATTMRHLVEMFLESDWGTAPIQVPSYDTPNPFQVFARIPAEIRSRFMIENSRVIVGGMTQGSVCVGSRATYAIRDHFWVWFLSPEADPSVLTPNLGLDSLDTLATAPLEWEPRTAVGRLFLAGLDRLNLSNLAVAKRVIRDFKRLAELTPFDADDRLVGEIEDSAAALVVQLSDYGARASEILGAIHHFYRTTSDNHKYQEAFERTLRLRLRRGLAVTDLWDGGSERNLNAWLNVTRHEKSASVQFGSQGGRPQNVWVLSYSNFERLYYNLVVSFKNWGSIPHRLATWRHMSYVRQEAEDLAISFLPVEHRASVRDSFVQGLGGIKNSIFFPLYSAEAMFSRPPRIRLPFIRPDLPPRPAGTPGLAATSGALSLQKLVAAISARLESVATPMIGAAPSAEQVAWESGLHSIVGRAEAGSGMKLAQFFPNVSYLKVTRGEGVTPWVYSLQVDRGYQGNNIVFAEYLNRDPQFDQLALYRGLVGAYPGVFLEITEARLGEFVADAEAIQNEESWARFQKKYGIARNSARFWPFFDWVHLWKATPGPGNDAVEQGIIDLSQYNFFAE